MNTIDAIMSRKSTRTYTDRKISEEDLNTILMAAMAGPSAVNARPWEFLVITDRKQLNAMADTTGRTARMLKEAPLAIMVCGNLEKALRACPDFWTVDAAISCQNMILAAHELGIGSVWIGTWPAPFSDFQQKLFNLPGNIIPHSIIAFGYPADGEVKRSAPPKFEKEKIHREKW